MAPSARGRRAPFGALPRTLLFLGMLLLPVDYFMPTAELFREAGAKPSILVFSVLALVSWAGRSAGGGGRALAMPCLCIFGLGSFAFGLNLMAGWSDFEHAKSPLAQFVSQAALLLLFSMVTIELSRVLAEEPARRFLRSTLLPVALFHLAVLGLEVGAGITHEPGTLLGLFRNDGGIVERPSGLMSEPSYFGVFAGIFGFALVFVNDRWRWFARALALALFVSALLIGAKTFVPVCALQLLGLLWFERDRIPLAGMVVIVLAFVVGAAVYTTSLATFDLADNLSSAMRIGSSFLSLNVAAAGYGVLGLGFGQFHFFYRPAFAPDFLLLSQEALNQMDFDAPGRASTYNLFFRLLVEGGVLSLVLFLLVIGGGLRLADRHGGRDGMLAILLTLGSVGFLLTQDPYFYPPLCLGLALCYSFSDHKSAPSAARRGFLTPST